MKRNNNEVKVVPPVLQGVETGNELFSELLVDDDEVDRRSFSREVVDGVDLSEVNVSSWIKINPIEKHFKLILSINKRILII